MPAIGYAAYPRIQKKYGPVIHGESFKKIIKSRAGTGGFVPFFCLSGAPAELLVKGKPVAEIALLFVGLFFGIGLRTVTPGTGKIKTAMAAAAEILPAGTAETPAKRLTFSYGLSTVPAHTTIITFLPDFFNNPSGRIDQN
jgi:hypothetical protein